MPELDPTPLEAALLNEFHRLYGHLGFPAPHRVRLRSRENTGAGRFVGLRVEEDTTLEDVPLDLGGKYIEMVGVPHGMMAVVWIREHRPVEIEIAVHGDALWDGEERRWSIA